MSLNLKMDFWKVVFVIVNFEKWKGRNQNDLQRKDEAMMEGGGPISDMVVYRDGARLTRSLVFNRSSVNQT